MNVTEKQKKVLLSFMRKHPDFGRGRLRYNRENKRKLDEMWTEVTSLLNSTGCGPMKTEKEWAKTWRDWKSNTLKKVASEKSYMRGTGGGSPKKTELTEVEEELMEFLSPDTAGLLNIPEGGFNEPFICSKRQSAEYNEEQDEAISLGYLHHENNHSIDPPSKNNIVQEVSPNIAPNRAHEGYVQSVLLSEENLQQDETGKKRNTLGSTSKIEILGEGKYLNVKENVNKKQKCDTVVGLLKEMNNKFDDYQKRILELKEEKIKLKREKLVFDENCHKELLSAITTIATAVSSLEDKVSETLCPQYLDPSIS